MKPVVFILDVDGVMTDGSFYYSDEGKVMKCFGADDADALSLLKPFLQIRFITGDKRGFNISKRRIQDDMGYPLDLVSTIQRTEWIKSKYDPKTVIFMGDGIFDFLVMQEIGYGIATGDADVNAKKFAHFITQRPGGRRAVAEACLHIREKFFKPFIPMASSMNDFEVAGDWNK